MSERDVRINQPDIRPDYWLWVSGIGEIGYRRKEELLRLFETPEALFFASDQELEAAGLTQRQKEGIRREKSSELLIRRKELLKEKGIRFISREDEAYPKRLLHIYCPPCGLYVKGTLPDEEQPAIAIVGARVCSAYGEGLAEYFAQILAGAGMVVVSGLADGVDAAAHRGVLKAQGITAAVLGCGVDRCYPKENYNLYREIGQKGSIISEYPPGSAPLQGNFPERNRIIAGLSDGILITEARKRSGSLITASLGLEQGKDIFAIPGRLGDSLSEGCNDLIRAGAKLVMTPDDILQEYERFLNKKQRNKTVLRKINKIPLETREKIVYDSLGLMPKHVDEIALGCGMGMSELSKELLALEMKGYVSRTAQNYYARCPGMGSEKDS